MAVDQATPEDRICTQVSLWGFCLCERHFLPSGVLAYPAQVALLPGSFPPHIISSSSLLMSTFPQAYLLPCVFPQKPSSPWSARADSPGLPPSLATSAGGSRRK